MKILTLSDIRSWSPCYDPVARLPESWTGTILDLLRIEGIPIQDRLWAALRTELVSERLMRLFAVWSYRQTLKFITNPDPRSLAAADTAERYANNEATREELDSAYSAAYSAYSAAYSARSAAYSAYSAAYSARSAAYSAADSAYSAYSAADSAYSAADSAAYSAARSAYSAARSAQIAKLIEMIEAENR